MASRRRSGGMPGAVVACSAAPAAPPSRARAAPGRAARSPRGAARPSLRQRAWSSGFLPDVAAGKSSGGGAGCSCGAANTPQAIQSNTCASWRASSGFRFARRKVSAHASALRPASASAWRPRLVAHEAAEAGALEAVGAQEAHGQPPVQIASADRPTLPWLAAERTDRSGSKGSQVAPSASHTITWPSSSRHHAPSSS